MCKSVTSVLPPAISGNTIIRSLTSADDAFPCAQASEEPMTRHPAKKNAHWLALAMALICEAVCVWRYLVKQSFMRLISALLDAGLKLRFRLVVAVRPNAHGRLAFYRHSPRGDLRRGECNLKECARFINRIFYIPCCALITDIFGRHG